MLLRSAVLVATCLSLACPSGGGAAHPAASASERALRIRVARAEAQRAGGVAELTTLATKGPVAQRQLALRGLGRSGAVKPLIAALGDPDPVIIGAAAEAIGVAASLDDGDLGATDALIAAIGRGGAPVIEAIGRAGTAAAQPALIRALATPNLAETAALALARHGRRKIAISDDARAALIAATASGDAAVRYAAVYALAREHQPANDPAVTKVLIARLGDADAETRAQAIAGLGRRKSVAAARAAGADLDRVVRDPDWRVAVEAVRALAGSDDGKDADAIASSLAARYDLLTRGDPSAAQVIVEAEKLLVSAAPRPLVDGALAQLATGGPAAASLPPLTRGWIACLAITARLRGRSDADLTPALTCPLPDAWRLPLVGELISADTGTLAARRGALTSLLRHTDPRVRAAGLAALPAMWKAGEAPDRTAAIDAVVAALADHNQVVASAGVDAAGGLYDAIGAGDHAALDTQVIARATSERDPELGASVLGLVGKRGLTAGGDACRAALTGDAVRAKAGAECLHALGANVEAGQQAPAAPPVPPVDVADVIGKALRWHVTTTRGEIVIRLRPDNAPWAVAAIVALTRKGFYDGLAFHRVVGNFVVQGGDPTESGSGGPGFVLPAEPSALDGGPGYRAGGVGIADAGRDSGGSQWFIMHSRAPHLDGRYTWFGTVEAGQNWADALLIGDRVVRATIEEMHEDGAHE